MYCIDCTLSKFISDENGETALMCLRHNKEVCAIDKCKESKKLEEINRAREIYLDNYKTRYVADIAKMIGWSASRLNYYIYTRGWAKR